MGGYLMQPQEQVQEQPSVSQTSMLSIAVGSFASLCPNAQPARVDTVVQGYAVQLL